MGRPSSRTIPYRWSSLVSVVLNQRADHTELRDANLRTGLLSAIDRSALLTTIFKGRGTVAELPLPSWSPLYDSSAVTPTLYSPADSQSYLDAAGWVHSSDGWTAPKGNGHLLDGAAHAHRCRQPGSVRHGRAGRIGLEDDRPRCPAGPRSGGGLHQPARQRRLRCRCGELRCGAGRGSGADAALIADRSRRFQRLGRERSDARSAAPDGAQGAQSRKTGSRR